MLDPIEGLELLRESIDNPNLVLIPFQFDNPHIPFSYPLGDHDANYEFIYEHVSDPDGRQETDVIAVEAAEQAAELILQGG